MQPANIDSDLITKRQRQCSQLSLEHTRYQQTDLSDPDKTLTINRPLKVREKVVILRTLQLDPHSP